MVQEVSQSDFQKEVLSQEFPVLVDFWAPWCGPCRMMAPILDKVSQNLAGQVKFAKVNTDDNQDLAMEYQITGIPCLVLFKNGQEIDRYVGVQQAAALENSLKKHL